MLVTVLEAIQSLGLSEVLEDQLEPVLSKALLKAQMRLEAELESKLDILDCVETFHPNSDLHNGVLPNGLLVLRLRNAFLKDSPVPVVTFSNEWKGEYSEMPTATFDVQPDKGLVFLDGAQTNMPQRLTLNTPSYDGQWVKVSYRSGFRNDQDTPLQVREALLALLPAVMDTLSDGNKDDKAKLDALAFANTLITPLKRARQISFSPVMYSAVSAPKP